MPKSLLALFPLVVSCRVYAVPLSHTSTVAAATYYVPLVVLSVFLLVILVAIKLVYMKQRRIGTIHALPGVPFSSSTTSLELRDKHQHRGLLVGCLGSPAWETNLTARLHGTAWRRRSSRDTLSTRRSTHTKSTTIDGSQSVLLLPGRPRVASTGGGSSSESQGSARQNASTHQCHPRCGDFGESRGLGLPRSSLRRVSPCSIRLVDGPSHSSQVEYAFLSGLPPAELVASPLMSARDSIQLSRCSLRYDRKPVPPLPPLPSFLALEPGKDAEEEFGEDRSLPELEFSPLVGAAKAFRVQQPTAGRRAASHASMRLLHNKSVAIPLCLAMGQTSFLAMPPNESMVDTKKPLKSCLRRNSVCSARTHTCTDQTSPRTPTSDDIGTLGLDRFHWNNEVKEKSSHMKKDSTVLAVE